MSEEITVEDTYSVEHTTLMGLGLLVEPGALVSRTETEFLGATALGAQEISVEDAYSKGQTTFMGLELLVAPGALVPRHETELLGTAALDALRRLTIAEPRIVDMCCGAGNLACAIAHYAPTAQIWASDLTDECVEVSRRNVAFHGLADRVSVRQGDLFEAFSSLELVGTIDMIVCNPPYISEKRLDTDRAHLTDLEPREAFAAGPYGLSIHMRVIKEAQQYLRPGGMLLFEVGLGQDRQVMGLLERSKAYEDMGSIANQSGEGRVVVAHMKRLDQTHASSG